MVTGAPTRGAETASSSSALSRTLRVTACWTDIGAAIGFPAHVRPRDGLRPTSPVMAEGRRMEPPPSLAWAAGRMPEDTAADAPPDDPPGERVVRCGFRAGPNSAGSVVAFWPHSGV